MRYAFAPFVFDLGANALVTRATTQCFKLQASGGASGVLGQLDDGQNRVGGGHPTGCYCLDSNGGFTDSNGRGCILTPPTTQFQCDVGATPNGFAISSGSGVTYNGSGKFYACPVNDNGEYNVYTTPVSGQTKCVEISLGSAGSCGAGTPPAGTKPAETPAKTPASQPPYPSSPTATGPNQPGNTGYPGKPSQSAPEAPKPTPEAPKPSQSAIQPPKPSSPTSEVPEVPQESECVPKVVTVTATASVAPPAETKSTPSKSAETKPTPPAASQPAPSKPAVSPPAPSQPTTTTTVPSKPVETAPAPSNPAASGNTCPQDLNGNYEYPHLIVPVDSEHPDKAYGTSYNGTINAHTCTIFNFDIPASMAGKKCSTMFMLPKKEDLETSDYTISGHGKCTVSKLKGNANMQTTYSNKPAKVRDVASMELTPGNTYPVESSDCEAGKTISYEICGSGDFSINYFQDWNPSPIGLYVRQC